MEKSRYEHLLKSLPEIVLNSVFYKLASRKAGDLASNPGRLIRMLQQGINRINSIENQPEALIEIKENLHVFLRMIIAFYKRKYLNIPWTTLLKIGAAIIYFLFPVDVIPDFIPVLGFLDDASVLALVVNAIRDDLNKFKAWEQSQNAQEPEQEQNTAGE